MWMRSQDRLWVLVVCRCSCLNVLPFRLFFNRCCGLHTASGLQTPTGLHTASWLQTASGLNAASGFAGLTYTSALDQGKV